MGVLKHFPIKVDVRVVINQFTVFKKEMFSPLTNFFALLLLLLHVVCCLPVQKGVTEVDINSKI